MKLNRLFSFAGAAGVIGLLSSAAGATIVFSDTFTDGGRTNGTDPTDIAWYIANQNQTVSVASPDTTFASNAMQVVPGGLDAFKRVVGFFSSTTLGNTVGDSITLSFDFHASVTNPNNVNGFRFGLYNSNGTQIATDESNTSYNNTAGTREDDDFGYNVRVPTGTSAAGDLLDEPAGDNTLGGLPGGTSIKTSSSNTSINNQLAHSFQFIITRGASSLGLVAKLDTVTFVSGTDTGLATPLGLVTTFDAVYFGTGSSTAYAYAVDNVTVEYSNAVVAPEPGSIALLGLVAGALVARRRRA